MVLQSTWFDPVLGLDMHIVGVPAPPAPLPVPTPIPIMFSGLVFDPLGLAVGAAIGMALGSGPGLVTVNLMPATNCGTEVWGIMGVPHIPVPGIIFMKTGAPIYTDNDAQLYFGSMSTSLGGTLGVRLGDIALSCSDPVRMPTSLVVAIPKGMPVLNMNPMVPDLMAIAMAVGMRIGMNLLRRAARALSALARRGAALFRAMQRNSRFFRRLSQLLGGCTPPVNASRLRAAWSRFVRTVTGHPVDVVTGNLFTDAIDADLPGPIPFVFERVYESCSSARKTALGYGWNHSYDESLWMERGRAVVRLGDNREVEFPLWDLPDRRMRVGDTLERVIHKMRLTCTGPGKYEIFFWDKQLVHEYAQVEGASRDVAKLVKVKSRDGLHAIKLHHRRGLLDSIRDSAGRIIELERDTEGRLRFLKLPLPHGRGWYKHREYVYDRMGDLVEVKDAAGESWRFEYKSLSGGGHLMVRETDRAGLSFYFQYDGTGEISKCVRTWGDGGIYDHVIHYDVASKKTIVENSLGHATVYEYNIRNRVTKVMDAVGAVTEYVDDPDTGGTIEEVSPSGGKTQSRYDAFGMLTSVTNALGHTTRIEYDHHHQPSKAIDVRGGEWQWTYDAGGRLLSVDNPIGARTTYEWQGGDLHRIIDAHGNAAVLTHDSRHQLVSMLLPNGGEHTFEYDEHGRVVKAKDPAGAPFRYLYDPEGRESASTSPAGVVSERRYDAEGNLLEERTPTRHRHFGYTHKHRIAWQEEDGQRFHFDYDTEDRVVALTNEAGERYEIDHDPLGRRTRERGFDGSTWEYVRDVAGLPVRVVTPRGTLTVNQYDTLGRLVEQRHSDGTFVRFEYGPDDQVERATNEVTEVLLERDLLGRVVRERIGDVEITSEFDLNGERVELRSSVGARESISRDSLGSPRAIHYGSANGFREPDVVFERDARGLETRRRFSSVEIAWSRDQSGRPTSRHVRTAGTSARQPRDLLACTYQWRGDDQLAAVLDATRGPRVFVHDRRGRVVRESTASSVIDRFVDSVGNIYASRGGADREFGPGGRLRAAGGVHFDYDDEGRRRSVVSTQGTGQYAWNEHGQLTRVVLPDGSAVTYEYDAFSRRTARRQTLGDGTIAETRFVWDGDTVLHELSSETGLTTWHWSPGTFTPLARERQGRIHPIGTDQNGTPCEIFDESGALVWQASVDVGGTWTFDVGNPDDCPWRWPGQHADSTTGLTYNRFRWFDASTSTYISPDPIRLEGGPSLYGYVNDPNWHSDPFGLNTHVGDAGERAAARWLAARGNTVLGGIQNSSGHGIDLVYRDPSGRVCIAEVKANSATLSAAQARGADSFGRSRLSRSAHWDLDVRSATARQALATWVAKNPTRRITGVTIFTDVRVDNAGRARGTVRRGGVRPWTSCS